MRWLGLFLLFSTLAAQGDFTYKPASIDFGQVPVGFSQWEDVFIRNVGNKNISVDAEDFFCRNDFEIFDDCKFLVRPNRTCNIRVYFSPIFSIPYDCKFEINDDTGQRVFIEVYGRGYDF